MNETEIQDLAERYTAAWCSQDPASLASFYSEDGVLRINDGEPSRGRPAIAETAGSFMSGYPDMTVELERVTMTDNGAVYNWRFTGTNSGPSGTGRIVEISGYEEWTLSPEGLIRESKGHYDTTDWDRQVAGL